MDVSSKVNLPPLSINPLPCHVDDTDKVVSETDKHFTEPDLTEFIQKPLVSRCISLYTRMDEFINAITLEFKLPEINKCKDYTRAGSTSIKPPLPHYWLSNDYSTPTGLNPEPALNYLNTLQALADKKKVQSRLDSIRLSFLIGESSILSSLPEVEKICDVVLLVDFDPLLLHTLIAYIRKINNCKYLERESEILESISKECLPEKRHTSFYDEHGWSRESR